MELEVLLPVYNEEKRLENGVLGTYRYLEKKYSGQYKITIVDNASIDRTREIAESLRDKYSTVEYLRLQEKGVGIAFRKGVENSQADIVGYMDIDLSTDVRHLEDVMIQFERESDTDIVNGARWTRKENLKSRKLIRRFTSKGLVYLLKLTLGMRASDAICGFKFFNRSRLVDLMAKAGKDENGWFYIIELLLRAERYKYKIVELPVKWTDDFNTTVDTKKLIMQYITEIRKLRKKFKMESI